MGAIRTLILRDGRSYGISDGSFLQALLYEHCAISNHSAAVCHRMSPTPTLTSTEVAHFGAKFREIGVTDKSQILTRSGRDVGLS